jgi:hypothetical protein
VPRFAHPGKGAEADRHQDKRRGQSQTGAEAVDDDTGEQPGAEPDNRVRGEHQSRDPEREAADVVQVDDRERVCDAVAEGVGEAAHLHRPDGPGESWV